MKFDYLLVGLLFLTRSWSILPRVVFSFLFKSWSVMIFSSIVKVGHLLIM